MDSFDIKHSCNTSFMSRCPQIRDAQWVCHTVNTTLPHASTSKLFPLYVKVLRNYLPNFMKSIAPKTLHDLSWVLDKLTLTNVDLEKKPFLKRLIHKSYFALASPEKKKGKQILTKIRENIHRFGNVRPYLTDTCDPAHGVFHMLSRYKLGNCYEDTLLAQIVLKINGIKNSTIGLLMKNEKMLDHSVCMFNRDGSKFEGKIKKGNTIIIDPWASKADFAENMLLYYKNMMKGYFDISKDDKLYFKEYRSSNLNRLELEQYIQDYPGLVFSNKTRNLMQK